MFKRLGINLAQSRLCLLKALKSSKLLGALVNYVLALNVGLQADGGNRQRCRVIYDLIADLINLLRGFLFHLRLKRFGLHVSICVSLAGGLHDFKLTLALVYTLRDLFCLRDKAGAFLFPDLRQSLKLLPSLLGRANGGQRPV